MVVVVVVRAVGTVEKRPCAVFWVPVLRKRGLFLPSAVGKTTESSSENAGKPLENLPPRAALSEFGATFRAIAVRAFPQRKILWKIACGKLMSQELPRKFSTFSADFSTTPLFCSPQPFAPRFPQFFPHFHILSPLPTHFSTPFPHPVENSVETVEKSCGEKDFGTRRPWGFAPNPT